MRDFISSFLDLFRPKKQAAPPGGVVRMRQELEQLRESTDGLRGKLQQHPEYYERNPITERIVPREYYTPQKR